jgi:MFS transporter, ACS family, solute carrier family 17 (sodium-dependent inorganic phosphate cotransporter), other
MAAGVACWSLATIATPYAAEQSTMGLLLFVRAIVGGAESVVLPSVQRLLSNWVPSDKKSLAVATVFAGFQSGTILAYTLSPVVLDMNMFDTTWRGLFYVYGGIGLLYLIPWLALAKDQPGAVPGVVALQQSQQTASKIFTNGGRGNADTPPTASAWESAKEVLTSAPWKEFAQSKAVWAMTLAHAANNWGLYNNLSWSPTFYAEQYGLNVRDSAILLVVPSLAGMVGGLSAGALADAAIRKFAPATDATITNVRKAFQGVALFGPALCLATMAWHVPDEPWVAQSLLTGTVGLQAFNSAGYGAANQEKAGEKWTGLLYGITSLPAVMLGTFGVYLTGQILDFTNQDWSYVFGLNALMNVLGATAFVALYDSKKEFD